MGVFTTSDYTFAQNLGIDKESLDGQWERLGTGFPTLVLDRPALVSDGIIRLSNEDKNKLVRLFESEIENYKISKFVPASGAASRMFLPIREMREAKDGESSKELLANIKRFPFYQDLLEKTKEKELDIDELIKDPKALADFILHEEGMDYDHYPKGLITFYNDGKTKSTAFEQQLDEAKEISAGIIHFTVAKEYIEAINSLLTKKEVTLSIQNPSTHFIAKHKGQPFRDNDGNLFFRPSGHGALLKNLNDLDAEIVFIKNIDNIQISSKNETSIKAKKWLGGYLFKLKHEIDTMLYQLEEDENTDLNAINLWIKKRIDPMHADMDKEELIRYLHRPIRIAGMVKNEGKAGGGPFWVRKGEKAHLQIVEAAQINTSDPDQKKILEASTHFNPVDIACSLLDHRGVKFDLNNYINIDGGFLSTKVIDGKEVTIMERPGLWNGSMSHWITVFIELPLESFTPVKTILDLLPLD